MRFSPQLASPEVRSGKPVVVRVIARLNVGGPALHTMHLTAGLKDRFPTVLATGEVGEDEADMSDEVVRRGVRLHRIPGLGRSVRPLDDLRALWHLVRLFRRLRPRIVHTHTAKAGTLGRIAAILTRVPVRVHTFHGHVFQGYFGTWATKVFLGIERLLARHTTAIIAISHSQADELVDTYRICGRDKVRVIPLGLELDRFAPESTGHLRDGFRAEIGAGDEPVISIVGRLVPIKNHQLFLAAAGELQRRGRRCTFVVVGGGSEESRLRRRAAELGLEDRVRFLGWRDDTPRIYAGSDIVALTSDNEGTPVCLIEALAAGRPAVSTDVGGVRDVLEMGRLGEMVPARQPAAFADAVERLIDDPDRCRQIARAGADASPRRFGVHRLLADMARLYQDFGVAPASVDTPVAAWGA